MDFTKCLGSLELQNQRALITEIRECSFQELDQISSQLAYRFLDILGKDNKVILCFQNQALHFIASIAALKAGLCQSASQAGSPIKNITKLALDTETQFIFSDFPIKPVNVPIKNIQLNIEQLFKDEIKQTNTAILPELDKQTALILPGSGTTGDSKLIAVDFENLDDIIQRDIKARPLHTGDIHLSFTPVEFYTSKRRSFAYLQNGACIFLKENPNTNLLELIPRYGIQHLSLAITHANEIIRLHATHPKFIENIFDKVSSVFLGGSPIPEKIRFQLNQLCNNHLYIVYGTNELGECCIASPELQQQFPDCVGIALEGVALEVIDNNNHQLPYNSSGELRIKTKGRGYYFNKKGDQKNKKNETWFYPKDNALIKDKGILVLQGRCDDAILFDGVIVYPRQIELVLEAYPGVLEVAVFALDINNNQFPALAFTAEQALDIKVIQAHLQSELGWIAPKFISQLPHMPKNPAGKILKRDIKDAFIRFIQNQKPLPQ